MAVGGRESALDGISLSSRRRRRWLDGPQVTRTDADRPLMMTPLTLGTADDAADGADGDVAE